MSTWKFEDSTRFTYPVYVVVEIDDATFTEEMAADINGFWTDADARLAAADEDVKRAAMFMVGERLIDLAIRYDGSTYLIQREFDSSEGFPPKLLQVKEVQALDGLEYEDLEVSEVPG